MSNALLGVRLNFLTGRASIMGCRSRSALDREIAQDSPSRVSATAVLPVIDKPDHSPTKPFVARIEFSGWTGREIRYESTRTFLTSIFHRPPDALMWKKTSIIGSSTRIISTAVLVPISLATNSQSEPECIRTMKFLRPTYVEVIEYMPEVSFTLPVTSGRDPLKKYGPP